MESDLDEEVAVLLPRAVQAHEIGVLREIRHGVDLAEVALPLGPEAELPRALLNGVQLPVVAVPDQPDLAGRRQAWKVWTR